MTYSSVRGHVRRNIVGADNVVDGLPQEAALVRELRRLQKFLEQEQRSGSDFLTSNRLSIRQAALQPYTRRRNQYICKAGSMARATGFSTGSGCKSARAGKNAGSTRQATGICKASGAPRRENAVAPRVHSKRLNG